MCVSIALASQHRLYLYTSTKRTIYRCIDRDLSPSRVFADSFVERERRESLVAVLINRQVLLLLLLVEEDRLQEFFLCRRKGKKKKRRKESEIKHKRRKGPPFYIILPPNSTFRTFLSILTAVEHIKFGKKKKTFLFCFG